MDDDNERDDAKRKSRNLSEKKRRDQFNILINELNSMVSSANRKLDKSTVLKATIAFLRQHNDMTMRSRIHEIHENWKPSFLSNEEFTHLMLEALDGFIIVFSSDGNIYYASESITSLLGHLPSDLLNASVYDLIYDNEQQEIHNLLSNPVTVIDPIKNDLTIENQVSFVCHMKKGGLEYRDEEAYESVQFIGYFRNDVEIDELLPSTSSSRATTDNDLKLLFVGIGRTQTPQLVREMTVVDSEKSEFTSRHSLEWKFIFLDHRATPIIGYLPFEVLGTSGYDYNHFDDLDNIVSCHETVMGKGEGNSGYYRFLTKSQQWIWLQTRFYISYHQWNSKPEFIVCTHRVVSNAEVLKQFSNERKESDNRSDSSKLGQMKPFDRKTGDKTTRTSNSSVRSRYSTSSPTPNTKSDSRNCATSVTETSISRTRSSPCFSSSSKASSKYSMSNQSSNASTITDKKLRKSDRSSPPSGNRSQSSMVKLEYPSASQRKQHREIAQEPYGNQMGNICYNSPSVGYLPPQYGITESVQAIDDVLRLTQDCMVISEKTLLPLGHQSPVNLPMQQPIPEILHRDAIITSTQSHIQNQLQRKHEELQQLIIKQQEELQLVSEQLHLAQRGMLPVVSSTQMDTQYVNRHPIRAHPHQMEKMGNHRTVLRLMDNSTVINAQQPYMEQPGNQIICPEVPNTPHSVKSVEQLPQVHSSQDYHTATALTTFDDANPASISPATPASITSTIGSIKFTSASE
ncbi:circadian locomoter output cycles protein kaput isoform X2 [Sitodiplosis mosellana]|uniref:circadian locomoter output cycles protein kaput isoform X2 n=1 Tax=Sitodiplosis mosellana TaxID=263140 RepID=UPI0024440573|nr:circadian locomoter output cycles protein kaput isoform X2 [Sitodiplosis mosellana]